MKQTIRDTQRISGAAHRLDQRDAAAAIDLGPETADVRLDDVRLRIEVILPHLFEQHLSRHHTALAAHEEFEQPKFARLQVDVLGAAPDGAGDQIHLEIAGLQDGRPRPERRPPRERGEPRHQLLEGEWLDEVVVAARLESVDPVVDAGKVGQKEHRRRHALRPHQRDDGQAVELRQHAVKDEHIEAIARGPLESLAPVTRDRRLVPACFEPRRDEAGGLLIVFDNQDLHRVELAERQAIAILMGRGRLPGSKRSL